MPGVGSGNARALLLFAVAWRCRGARPDIWRHGIEAPDDVKAAWPAHPPMYTYAPAAAKAPRRAPSPTSAGGGQSLTSAQVDGLKVVELKDELRARGLPVSGRKQVLADRLKEALAE